MIEGWACYVQDLMLEVAGFYTPQETMLLKQYEMRNAAMCLADIRLHCGVWNLDQMRAFYRDQVRSSARQIVGRNHAKLNLSSDAFDVLARHSSDQKFAARIGVETPRIS